MIICYSSNRALIHMWRNMSSRIVGFFKGMQWVTTSPGLLLNSTVLFWVSLRKSAWAIRSGTSWELPTIVSYSSWWPCLQDTVSQSSALLSDFVMLPWWWDMGHSQLGCNPGVQGYSSRGLGENTCLYYFESGFIEDFHHLLPELGNSSSTSSLSLNSCFPWEW